MQFIPSEQLCQSRKWQKCQKSLCEGVFQAAPEMAAILYRLSKGIHLHSRVLSRTTPTLSAFYARPRSSHL